MTDFAEHSKSRRAGKRRRVVLLLALCAAASGAGAEPRAAASSQDGKYFDAEGEPTYKVDANGKVDWYTYSGFLRYSAECLRCHGPDGLGSSYAPALANSLKKLSYADFLSTVANGRKNLEGGQEKVMPTLGLDKNVMCFIDDIYVYLKARSDEAVGRNRPPAHDPKPKAWEDAENACMGAPS
ncbi:methanol metabolism-related c-type cytochrome [Rhodoblastus acidophilus]|nr:methanol metabolism-related c-type cytochrome [Rhodoblastus acidophilus]